MADKKEVIYADKLRKAIVDDVDIRGAAFAAVMRHLQAAPTVDAVEVVHARWIKNGWNDYSCSACKGQFIGHGAFGWKYCPNCGAKMDGGNEDV